MDLVLGLFVSLEPMRIEEEIGGCGSSLASSFGFIYLFIFFVIILIFFIQALLHLLAPGVLSKFKNLKFLFW